MTQINLTISAANRASLTFIGPLAVASILTHVFLDELADVASPDTPIPVGVTGDGSPSSIDQPTAPPPAGVRIGLDNYDSELSVGAPVHWKGAKFEFDGKVTKIDDSASWGDKAVWVRRDDTGKLVSLTYDDLDTGVLIRHA